MEFQEAFEDLLEWCSEHPFVVLVVLFIVGALLFSLGTCAG